MTMFENDNPIMPRSDDGGGGNISKILDIESIDQLDYGEKYCLASCYLAIARYYHPDKNLTMARLKREGIVDSDGYVNYWGDYCSRTKNITFDRPGIKVALSAGNPVVISGRSATDHHYVVAYGYTGGDILVMDPWGGVKKALGKTTLKTWLDYFVCTE